MIDIPLVDIRAGGPQQLLRDRAEQTRSLIVASRRTFGPMSDIASGVLLPIGDRLSRSWLVRSGNPYLGEIEYITRQLNTPGVHALNVCFEWGCTSAIYDKENGPTLTRVMDWMFPQLGENIVVAHQSGKAGDFYNITWPGVSGMFQGIAPGRFAASLNQAPMQRHRLTYVGDWVRNRRNVFRGTGLPPAHLLRKVFGEAENYEAAKRMLSQTPVAIPVIYILSGIKPGEGCVIERTENDFAIRDIRQGRVCAANHFETRLDRVGHGWRPRRFKSHDRARQAQEMPLSIIDDQFSWFRSPIANTHTRLAMMACPAAGTFSVFGTQGQKPVTNFLRVDGG